MTISNTELDNLFSNFNDDDNDDTNGDGFLLPSQRKKMMNNSGKGKKTKRRPPKQTEIDLDKILEDDDDFGLDDGFQLNSDKISPLNSDLDKSNEASSTKETKPKEKLTSRGVIEQIENSLNKYISVSLSTVKQNFIDELKVSLDNSKEEESIIDAFVLGLPSDIEEIISQDLQREKESMLTKSNTILETIESFLDQFRFILPPKSKYDQEVSINKVCSDIQNYRLNLNEKYDKTLREYQTENEILQTKKQEILRSDELRRLNNPRMMILVEAEADSKRLEVEEQFLFFKKKYFNQLKSDWKESQMRADEKKFPENDEIFCKLSDLSKKISQSKYKNSIVSAKSISQNIQNTIRDAHKARKQAEIEVSMMLARINSKYPRNQHNLLRGSHDNQMSRNIKKQLDLIRRQRDINDF